MKDKVDHLIKLFKGLGNLDKISLVMAAILVGCLLPMPYGFYTMVRLAMAIVAGCWGYRFYKCNKMTSAIVAGTIVILFQPLIKIALDRITWNILDVTLAVTLFVLVLNQKRQTVKD